MSLYNWLNTIVIEFVKVPGYILNTSFDNVYHSIPVYTYSTCNFNTKFYQMKWLKSLIIGYEAASTNIVETFFSEN